MSEKKFKYERDLEVVSIFGCVDGRLRVRMQAREEAKPGEESFCHDVMMASGVMTDDDLGMKVTLTIEERKERNHE